MGTELTKAEQVFVARMLPHFMAGKSVEESARAVLEDDARLLGALSEKGGYAWCGDILGARALPGNPSATSLRGALCQHVYHTIRAAA